MLSLAELALSGMVIYGIKSISPPSPSTPNHLPEYDIYRQRTMEGFSRDTKDAIQLATFSDSTLPVGSFKYKVHRYPGDVDIFEPVKLCCTKESAINSIVGQLKHIAQSVINSRTIFWGDFKAGLDMEYEPDHPNYIVRWTAEEISAGSKRLMSGNTLTLAEAIVHKTIIKLDLWAPVNGNYTEVTNFFLFVWTDGKGNDEVLNAPLGDRLESLDNDIRKYSSPAHWKPLKLSKRLWNKALLLRDENMTRSLYPLFSSGAAIANQVTGECETLAMMFRKINPEKLPLSKINTQIDLFKKRLDDIVEFEIDKSVYALIDRARDNNDPATKANILDKVQELLDEPVSDFTSNWLITHRIIGV